MTTVVTSTEFQRNVGTHTQNARREPVIITNHGQPSLAVIAAEDYERLRKLDDRVSCHPADMPEDMIQALEESIARDDAAGIVSMDLPLVKF